MKVYIVDSFTDTAFKGNPAGVCLLESKISDHLMLKIAQELNLSETAFVVPAKGRNTLPIRYFSPKMEIPLCGHATLAAAKVVFDTTRTNYIEFCNIQNIILPVKSADNQIVIELPAYDTRPSTAPDLLLTALGIDKIENAVFNEETNILLLEITDVDLLANLKPDYESLYKSHNSINGVLVTAQSENEYDFYSRYFWPWSGTNEDPVTGGTHTFLARYWSEKLGKTTMKSFQCSQRSGFMDVEITESTVRIKGSAVTVFKGELVANV